ncbi:MAG: helix-turn-helix transcriptional regulator [Campylobacterales bacterium]|nr:helix-turn-helix transcriptional regulator [Campylobacterales bacterium]
MAEKVQSINDDFELKQFYKTVGANVKRIRQAKGYSQLKLANALGYQSVGHIAKAELNKYNKVFNLEHLHKISKILDVQICEFFEPSPSN